MADIELNFLPLSKQDFFIKVYRRQMVDPSTKSRTGSRFRLKLEDSEEYALFDVSWDSFAEATEYMVSAFENFDLTKQYLKNRIETVLADDDSIKFYSSNNSFYKELRVVIEEHNEGQVEIRLQPYFLSTTNQFGFLLKHHFRVAKGQQFNREVQKLSLSLDHRYRQNRSFYSDKYRITTEFAGGVIRSLGEITNGVSVEPNLVPVRSDSLANKSYVVGKGQISNSQYSGIKRNGPYQAVEDSVKFLFVFTESLRSLARDVYAGLDGKLYSGIFPGLSPMFKLPFGQDLTDHQLINQYDQHAIKEISDRAVAMQEGGKYKVFVLTFFPASMSDNANKEAYSQLKLSAINNGYFTQGIKQETMGKKEQLKWSIGNIGLQIFSKLGGIPWLMSPAHRNCLILGIGSAHAEDGDGHILRYTAYTICLDTEGNFRQVRPLSSSSNENDYLGELKKELIREISDEKNREVNECVIHLPYKIRRNEIEAIRQSVEAVRTDVKFSIKVIKINTKHRFFGFSTHNTKVPYESTMVKLSNQEYLIWTEGLQYGKSTISKRISEPIHVEFLYGAAGDYNEDKAYIQDIVNLTGANWRGFNSKAQPISIYYSQLIARFMRRFGESESVGDLSVLSQESSYPWFL